MDPPGGAVKELIAVELAKRGLVVRPPPKPVAPGVLVRVRVPR